MRRYLYILFLCIGGLQVFAQQTGEVDTTAKVVKEAEELHSVKKAVWLALTLPGAGQMYNRSFWKVPLVWGALGATIYFAIDNNRQYQIFSNAFDARVDTNRTDQFEGIYDPQQLISIQNAYRQDRDLMIILAGLSYVLQLVDAYVDAHLFHYDISDDLTLHWKPTTPNVIGPRTVGLSFTLQFDARNKPKARNLLKN